jgi:hypothetical protein
MIPKSVQVGPVAYEVTVVKNLGSTHHADGVTNTWHGTIDLGADQHPDHQRVSFLHEVIHAVWNCAYEAEDEREKYTQEQVVRILTPTLLDVLRRNPHVVSYLMEGVSSDAS